jgi:hypothetical protein
MGSNMDTDVLRQLIGTRCNLLLELSQLVQRQSDLVLVGDVNGLLSLLAAKQHLLNDLLRVDGELDPFREQDPEARIWRSEADRDSTRKTAERCQVLLADVLRIERQCEAELIRRRDHTASLIDGLHGAARATQAYGNVHEFLSGTQLDLSCET